MVRTKFIAVAIAIAAISGVGAASAADMAPRTYTKAPPMAAPVYSWTGCYVGVEGGGIWGHGNHFQNDPAASAAAGGGILGLPQTAGIDPSGGLAGGTVGCNYQFAGNWVIGIEGDISWTSASASAGGIAPFNLTDTFSSSQRWMDTVRGRIGYAWDRVLVYGTGGAAFTGLREQVCDPPTGCASATNSVTGWVAGAGVEWAFYQNWSAKLEYLHADFGTTGFGRTFPPGGGFFAARNVTLTDDMVRVGVNYRFNWGGPVVARY
jgi:outer membrane immunogenic protein